MKLPFPLGPCWPVLAPGRPRLGPFALLAAGLLAASPAARTQPAPVPPPAAVVVAAAVDADAEGASPELIGLLRRADALIERGQAAQARPLVDQALALAEREQLGTRLPMAWTLAALSEVQGRQGQLAQALASTHREVAIRKPLQGPDHARIVTALRREAAILVMMARHEEALQIRMQSLAMAERVHGPGDPETARILSQIAVTNNRLADHPTALRYGLRAVAALESALGADHLETAGARMSVAAAYSSMAQYDKALPESQRAAAIYELKAGPNHVSTAQALSNLAVVHSRLGQHEQALQMRLRTLAIMERIRGPEHDETAINLNNLAQSYAALGQHDKALPLQERALAIREKTYGPDHPRTAIALNNLSQNRFGLGDHDAALQLQLRALAIREKTLGAQHPDTASSLNNAATLYRAMGQSERALPFQQRAYAAYAARLGPDHPSTAVALAGLAQLHLGLGDLPLAIALLKQAVNTQQTMREQAARIDAEALRSYTNSVSTFYQQLATALSDAGRLPEAQLVLDMLKEDEQFNFVRRSNGADPGRTRIGYNAAEQAWSGRYSQISGRLAAIGAEQQALDRLSRQPGVTLTPEQRQRRQALTADLAVAQSAFEAFLGEVRADFAAKGAARTAELAESSVKALAELRELLKGLGEGTVLLQIYLTDDRVNLLLTSPGVQLARSVKVSARDLNRQIGQFRRLLRDPRSDPLPVAQALYRLLIEPVAPDLEQAGAKTVMLSLDGALRYLPFGALHDGQRHLVERWNLPVYTSVTRDRLRDAVAPAWRAAGLGVTRKIGEFDALPGVRSEMSGIIRGPAEAGPAGAMPGEIHLDEAFTAQRLMDVSRRRFPVLHLASHFRFSPGTEADSFLLLGDGQRLSLGELRRQDYRFDQVDLLTLSACETGLGGGRDDLGREIEGFGVIAQQQGARAVLATLWSVADQSTALLMADTYRRRETQRLSKSEALRQAQLALQAQPRYAHPFYWAPFILMGNWK